MFTHSLSPEIFSIGPLALRWYSLFYVLGFVFLYIYLRMMSKKGELKLKEEQIESFIVYMIIGVVLGSRIVYTLFYNPSYYLSNPLSIFAVWQGGLSFHGGVIGAILAGYIFCRRNQLSFLKMADFVAIPLALALFLGRVGNFINGELVGRITNVSWCVNFQGYDGCRHPSQLYESAKNLAIFFILIAVKKYKGSKLPPGFLIAFMLWMYAVLRFAIGFFRAPDPQLGFIAFGLTMGQLLNIALFVATTIWMIWLKKTYK